MNDFESRLHGALRDAVADPVVPGGLLTDAARRAVRIRRRRVATRGAVGAAAVVATGAVVARPASSPAPLSVASASASASAPAAGEMLRITISHVPCESAPSSGANCVRTEIDIEGDSPSRVEDTALESNTDGVGRTPAEVTVTFKDGTRVTVVPRKVGEGRWVAEFPGRTRDDIATVSYMADGDVVEPDFRSVPAPATSAPS